MLLLLFAETKSRIQLRGKNRVEYLFLFCGEKKVLINLTIRQGPGGRIGPKKHSSIFFSQVALLIFLGVALPNLLSADEQLGFYRTHECSVSGSEGGLAVSFTTKQYQSLFLCHS